MLLTLNIKHQRDFKNELAKARLVAEYSLVHHTFNSSDVKHIGLKSEISNQILRKYGNQKNIKKITSVPLIVPGRAVKLNEKQNKIYIPCLKLHISFQSSYDIKSIKHVEIDAEFAHVTVQIDEPKQTESVNVLGVDRNVTGHVAVCAIPQTGKVFKLGKECNYIHKKYKNIRRNAQKNGKYNFVRKLKDRESRITKDINHKISKKIVEIAKENNCSIQLEDLSKMNKTNQYSSESRDMIHSWSYYQLQQFIEYKAKLNGILVTYTQPAFTSKLCSKCGSIGTRDRKSFICPSCGHIDHADSNASFNIALSRGQLYVDSDAYKRSIDTRKSSTSRKKKNDNL